MLSGSAFNALLKTLEEPPAHAVFVLATTELHKLPSTIVSRCQRHDFRRIATDTLVQRLSYIADQEKIEYEPSALRIIAKMAQGGMRDAISLLELCAGNREKITTSLVNETLGVGGREAAQNLVKAIAKSDFDTIFSAVENVVRSSKDIGVFWQDLISFYRDMLVVKTTKTAKNYLDLTDDELENLLSVASLFTKDVLLYHCRILDQTYNTMLSAVFAKRTVAEMALVKMCDMSLDTSNDAILARLSKLENTVAAGAYLSVADSTEVSAEKTEGAVLTNAPVEEAKSEAQALPTTQTLDSAAELKVLR
jgi:DNA polymerase-3 subunit gamma/tau